MRIELVSYQGKLQFGDLSPFFLPPGKYPFLGNLYKDDKCDKCSINKGMQYKGEEIQGISPVLNPELAGPGLQVNPGRFITGLYD